MDRLTWFSELILAIVLTLLAAFLVSGISHMWWSGIGWGEALALTVVARFVPGVFGMIGLRRFDG